MSALHTPFTHIPYNHYSIFTNRLYYASTFPPPITLHHLPKLTFSASSSSSVLPTVVDNGSHNVERDSKKENQFVDEKEMTRRMRIGLANKGKAPWNKGRKHTAGTILGFMLYFIILLLFLPFSVTHFL